MATKLLPVTNIELPNDEWEMKNFKENKAFSEETMCFTAVLIHRPTKVRMEIRNDGHGGSDLIMFDQRQPKVQEAMLAWEQFIVDCQPALIASVAHEEEEWLRNLYNNSVSAECVIALFTSELSNQMMLSRKRGTVVRTNADDDSYRIYKATPEQLTGRVQGQYWNKAIKNWSDL